ncbi:MAG TPA: ATP-binding protein [Thermoanaerobaculia bacterium]|nr:ATP-binding protein [Thermoanaerobaculia bacterium]
MTLSRIPFHRRLGFKITATAAAAILVPVAIVAAVTIRAQHDELVARAQGSAAILSETVRSATHDFMLKDQREDAYRIVEIVGHESLREGSSIESVRIFNKQGATVYSTDRAEIGRIADKSAGACAPCHGGAGAPIANPDPATRSRISAVGDRRVLSFVTPIYNEAACAAAGCHAAPKEQRVLGLLDVALSLRDVDDRRAAATWRIVGLSLLALVALTALVSAIVRVLVFRPVSDMLAATKDLAHGGTPAPLPIRSDDELGMLGRSFNEMSDSLRKARAELERAADGLERQVEERTAALQRAQEALVQSEKLVSLGTLSASIAHEINNPLAGILTFARLMTRTLESGEVDDAARAACLKNLGLIQRETERCTRIVRSLLDFARARPIELHAVDAVAALDEAVSLTQHKLQLEQVAVTKDLDGAAVVQGDFGQLRQVFVNLILNACDAMPGGGTLTVTARKVDDGRTVEIALSDTGAGIAPEHLSRIFDPFFTTKQMGTGLGLSVAYGVVEKHGGSMKAVSRVGAGTTMTIRLPLAGETAAPAGAAA